MSLENIVGYIACVNIALLQVPQVIKTYKSKKADDLSWGMILLNVFASILWFSYGFIIMKYPIIIANICYFIANIFICIMKVMYNDLSPGSNVVQVSQVI